MHTRQTQTLENPVWRRFHATKSRLTGFTAFIRPHSGGGVFSCRKGRIESERSTILEHGFGKPGNLPTDTSASFTLPIGLQDEYDRFCSFSRTVFHQYGCSKTLQEALPRKSFHAVRAGPVALLNILPDREQYSHSESVARCS